MTQRAGLPLLRQHEKVFCGADPWIVCKHARMQEKSAKATTQVSKHLRIGDMVKVACWSTRDGWFAGKLADQGQMSLFSSKTQYQSPKSWRFKCTGIITKEPQEGAREKASLAAGSPPELRLRRHHCGHSGPPAPRDRSGLWAGYLTFLKPRKSTRVEGTHRPCAPGPRSHVGLPAQSFLPHKTTETPQLCKVKYIMRWNQRNLKMTNSSQFSKGKS